MTHPAQLRFLGLPRAELAGQPMQRFESRKALALLAYLASRGEAVARSQLAALFWPAQPDERGRANLRHLLHTLAAQLPGCLAVDRQSVRLLGAPACWVDTSAFEEAATQGTLAGLGAAADLYRSAFLDGVALDDCPELETWLAQERERWHERAAHVLADLSARARAGQEWVAGLRAVDRLLALDPWREAAHQEKMRLLALSGQRDTAMAQYEVCRRILADELGLDPTPETTALYEQIRDGLLAPPSAPAARAQVPTPPTPLLGRAAELAQLAQLLAQPACRLLTLVGLGGMGKTRLALELARSQLPAFPDGVFVVQLAPLATTAAIAPAIATALGIAGVGDPQQSLLNALRDRHLLLVLDNFEHLRDGVEVVVEMLQAAPRLVVLATSRERLHVRGEHVYTVQGLAYAPNQELPAEATASAQLFMHSIERVQPTIVLDAAQLAQIARICALLEGMPLAIELAAAWAESLPLQVIASEIERSFDFLTSEWRDIPERQRSVRAVFDWSWRLLNDDERQVLRRLAVFRGGFTGEAAQTIAGASLLQLGQLVRKSLLQVVALGAAEGRYAIHEVVRQFAAEQLGAATVERAAVEAAHSAFYLQFVAARERRLAGGEPQAAVRELQVEIDNLRLAWMSAASQLQIDRLNESAFGLWLFFLIVGHYAESERRFAAAAEQLLERLIDRDAPGDIQHYQRVASNVLALRARVLSAAGAFEQALTVAQQAIAIGAAGGGVGELLGLTVRGQALCRLGEVDAGRASLEHVIARLDRPDSAATDPLSRYVEWDTHVWLGWLAQQQDDFARAAGHFEQGLAICQTSGSARGEALCLSNLAAIDTLKGGYAAARPRYEQALRLARMIGYRWGEAVTQFELGWVVRMLGDYGLARSLIERALALFRDIGDDLQIMYAVSLLGRLYALMGDTARARQWLDQYGELTRSVSAPDAIIDGLLSLAILAQQTGAYTEALAHAERGRQVAQRVGNRLNQARALILIGHAYVGLQGQGEAAAAYAQAAALCVPIGNLPLAAEPQAALAWLTLSAGDSARAMALVETALATLAAHPQSGLDEPFSTYLLCYRVLGACHDPRAPSVLRAGQQLLQSYADTIDDAALRSSFLNQVAVHRELYRSGLA